VAIEDAYELAYREAVRALDHQLAALTELRGRAGVLLAAASITVSLLGRESFGGPSPCAWAAMACFVLLSVCVLVIVWPHEDWSVDVDPPALLLARLSARTATASDLNLELIGRMSRYRHLNDRRLTSVARGFRVGACLLATQIVLTVVAVSGIV
jgi:hypothetical protein